MLNSHNFEKASIMQIEPMHFQHNGWAADKELELSYYNKGTLLFAIYPCYVAIIW